MKKLKFILVSIIVVTLTIGCDVDEIVQEEEQTKNARRIENDTEIISFEFLVRDNPRLKENIIALIDEDTKTIRVRVTDHIDITTLIPSIRVSSGVKAKYESYNDYFKSPVVHVMVSGPTIIPTPSPYPIIICGPHDLPCPP